MVGSSTSATASGTQSALPAVPRARLLDPPLSLDAPFAWRGSSRPADAAAVLDAPTTLPAPRLPRGSLLDLSV